MSLWSSKTLEKRPVQENGAAQQEPPGAMDARRLCSEITIQIPHRKGEGIHPELATRMCEWVNAGIAVAPVSDPFGGFIELTRNYMVREFLRGRKERKYLLMLDNDVVPMHSALPLQLASHGKPVVTGVACGFRPDNGIFACFTVLDKTGIARFPTRSETRVMPAEGLGKIESCGAGVVMIRRDVLESIGADWFTLPEALRRECEVSGVLRKTEDMAFCDRVRAAGFDLYVDFAAHCFHDKNLPLHWQPEALDPNLKPEDWDVTSQAKAADEW